MYKSAKQHCNYVYEMNTVFNFLDIAIGCAITGRFELGGVQAHAPGAESLRSASYIVTADFRWPEHFHRPWLSL